MFVPHTEVKSVCARPKASECYKRHFQSLTSNIENTEKNIEELKVSYFASLLVKRQIYIRGHRARRTTEKSFSLTRPDVTYRDLYIAKSRRKKVLNAVTFHYRYSKKQVKRRNTACSYRSASHQTSTTWLWNDR